MAMKRQSKSVDLYARLGQEIVPWLRQARFDRAIAHCEAVLASLPATPYHKVTGRSWLHQTEEAARWLVDFFGVAKKNLQVRAIYCEMNRFEINPQEWRVDGFAYDFFGKPTDPDWLCGWQETSGEHRLVLSGMKDLQALFARDYADEPPGKIRASSEVAIHLLSLRMQELVHGAARQARSSGDLPEEVPVLAAVHDSDLIAISYGRIKPPITLVGPLRPRHSRSPRNDGRLGIYRLSGGWDRFQNSLPWDTLDYVRDKDEETVGELLDRAKVLQRTWKPPKLKLRRRKWRCDLLELGPCSHWAANEKAMQALVPLLGKTVEYLPASCDSEQKLYVLHPLEQVDLAAGAIHNGINGNNMSSIQRHDFNLKELAGKHLFGVKQAPHSAARKGGFCFAANYVSEEFKLTYARHGLQGAVFEEVFSYSAGNGMDGTRASRLSTASSNAQSLTTSASPKNGL